MTNYPVSHKSAALHSFFIIALPLTTHSDLSKFHRSQRLQPCSRRRLQERPVDLHLLLPWQPAKKKTAAWPDVNMIWQAGMCMCFGVGVFHWEYTVYLCVQILSYLLLVKKSSLAPQCAVAMLLNRDSSQSESGGKSLRVHVRQPSIKWSSQPLFIWLFKIIWRWIHQRKKAPIHRRGCGSIAARSL